MGRVGMGWSRDGEGERGRTAGWRENGEGGWVRTAPVSHSINGCVAGEAICFSANSGMQRVHVLMSSKGIAL